MTDQRIRPITWCADLPQITIFHVAGIPIPQGSKSQGRRRNGTTVLYDANPKLKEWRRAIAARASEKLARRVAAGLGPYDCPLFVDLLFTFPMPKSRSAADKQRGTRLRDTTPDLDKLIRAVFDALDTDSGLIANDSRIVEVCARKQETTSLDMVGVEICISDRDISG